MTQHKKRRLTKKAKQDHYLARSVYKLMELEKKHKLFHSLKAGTIIELGISPGSWVQYYQKIISPEVFVIGVDLKPFKAQLKNGIVLVQDMMTLKPQDLIKLCRGPVQAVLSDALPNITGSAIRDQVAISELRAVTTGLMRAVLKKGGFFIIKTFYEPSYDLWVKELRRYFRDVSIEKPKASRKESPELYVIGKGYVGRQ